MTEFSDHEREELAGEGNALPDGSYPIRSCDDLHNAIQAYGRAPEEHRAALRRHIARRKIELGCPQELPEGWRLSHG